MPHFFSLSSSKTLTQISNPKHLPMKLGPWSNLFWSQEDQRNSIMLRASMSFKEVVLWVIFFFFCQQITWHFPMPFLHLSTVENNTSAHMETHTQNQNRNIIQDSNPLTIAGFKQSKMTSFFFNGCDSFFNCIIHLYREITSYDKRHEALRAFTSSVVFQFQRYLIWS